MSVITGLSIIICLIVAFLAAEFVRHYLHYREAGDSPAEAALWAWYCMRPWI